MLDGSDNAGSGRKACLSDTQSWIHVYQLLIREPSCTWILLEITSHLSWFQCLSSICTVKLTFDMSPQSSSKWHIYSYVPINNDQIYCYQCTAKPWQFRLQFWLNSMSSPLNVFSDITLKYLAFGCSFFATLFMAAPDFSSSRIIWQMKDVLLWRVCHCWWWL